jgi:hypothetical protein
LTRFICRVCRRSPHVQQKALITKPWGGLSVASITADQASIIAHTGPHEADPDVTYTRCREGLCERIPVHVTASCNDTTTFNRTQTAKSRSLHDLTSYDKAPLDPTQTHFRFLDLLAETRLLVYTVVLIMPSKLYIHRRKGYISTPILPLRPK